MQIKTVDRSTLEKILHSHDDFRYLDEFLEYVDEIVDVINAEWLSLSKLSVDVTEVPVGTDLKHNDLVEIMEGVIKAEFKSQLENGYMYSAREAGYEPGVADILVCDSENRAVVAVEVGQVYARKPLLGFYHYDYGRTNLHQLWVCPYQAVESPRLDYYIFEPGHRFEVALRHWEEERRRWMEESRRQMLLTGPGAESFDHPDDAPPGFWDDPDRGARWVLRRYFKRNG